MSVKFVGYCVKIICGLIARRADIVKLAQMMWNVKVT